MVDRVTTNIRSVVPWKDQRSLSGSGVVGISVYNSKSSTADVAIRKYYPHGEYYDPLARKTM